MKTSAAIVGRALGLSLRRGLPGDKGRLANPLGGGELSEHEGGDIGSGDRGCR